MGVKVSWNPKETPEELHSMLEELGKFYPLAKKSGTANVSFTKAREAGVCKVSSSGNKTEISYHAPAQAGRALGLLMGGVKSANEKTPFRTFGIMLDCSRNAVMKVEHLRIWLRRLALMGYNMVMLYTEDTYELPGEPYFGYQRGAYTEDELKEIDDYAALLGIEVIPCIQTLGHMEKVLRHHAYNEVRDTARVMLAEEEKTYKLIDKMLRTWKKVCRTSRVHIGMDETHDLGRGKYMDLHGYKNGFDIFNQHLAKVVKLCKKHRLEPMIWSDMYFRLGSKTGDYYDKDCKIPERVIKKIPAEAELVYWDYYHDDVKFYEDWIDRHRKMKKEPLMGSGIWTWNKYWYDHRQTTATAGPCIDACYKKKVEEIFFTQWGDNGAYCDHDSAFAGMLYCAERGYGKKNPNTARLEKVFSAVCGGSYQAHILASEIHNLPAGINSKIKHPVVRDIKWNFQPEMWEDPIFETHLRSAAGDKLDTMKKVAAHYGKLADKLEKHRRDRDTGDLKHACNVARAFHVRYDFFCRLLAAYRKGDKRRLRTLIKEITRVRRAVGNMESSFREMWMNHNKPEGIKDVQDRFGMLDVRYAELTRRLKELVDGKVKVIEEFEYNYPPTQKTGGRR